ncbi:unnamed protein product [Spodoptera exigua]|nr:unnamed protein product [Spodoptera exigua]
MVTRGIWGVRGRISGRQVRTRIQCRSTSRALRLCAGRHINYYHTKMSRVRLRKTSRGNIDL